MNIKPYLKFLQLSYLILTVQIFAYSHATETSQKAIPSTADFSQIADEIDQLLQKNIYDPNVLSSLKYNELKVKVKTLSIQASNESEFIQGFNHLWKNGPFSHVNLTQSTQTVEQMAAYFDQMNVGGNGASLQFLQDTAVLTVNTMMGQDTIAQIVQAYEQLAKHNPENLIIDLRNNSGGAFAIRPLVGHMLKDNFDAGVFLSKNFALAQTRTPTEEQINTITPWQGWSLQSFWHDAETQGITRVQFDPLKPTYSGSVYILVSNKTASAAELAAEAMRASGRATLIGETTAGSMLSQKPYKLTNGWVLFIPFANYVSKHSGRIEGKGLEPDIKTKSEVALTRAIEHINKLNKLKVWVKSPLPIS